MSDTSICDECFNEAQDFPHSSLVIPLSVGRQLERERDALRAEIESMRDALKSALTLIEKTKVILIHSI
jgi:hypothetical protein